MQIEVKPKVAAVLRAQVASGHFESLEAALEAAVLGIGADGDDLSWAKPYLDAGLADIAAGRTASSEVVHDELRRRFQRPTAE